MTDPNGTGGGNGSDDFGGEFLPGEMIKDQLGPEYRVGGVIGRGGHATVYDVLDCLGQGRVIKVVKRHLARDKGMNERFDQEARILARLRHENIVQVYTAGVTAGRRPQAFIVMERLVGYDGRKLVEHGPVEDEVAIETLIDIVSALVEAHRAGIIHQDLKLDNIFCHYDPHKKKWVVKLLDFGVARAIDGDADPARFAGTVEYAAPEQLIFNAIISFRIDLYALGVLAFELFTGQRPHHEAEEMDEQQEANRERFEGRNDDLTTTYLVNAKLNLEAPRLSDYVEVNRRIDDLVAALLEVDPAKRPADAESVLVELKEIAEIVGSKVRKTTTQEFRASIALARPSSKPTRSLRRRVIELRERSAGTGTQVMSAGANPREAAMSAPPMQGTRPLVTEPMNVRKRPSNPSAALEQAHVVSETEAIVRRMTVRGIAPGPEPTSALARAYAEPQAFESREEPVDPRPARPNEKIPNSQVLLTREFPRPSSAPPPNGRSPSVRPTAMGLQSPPGAEVQSYVEPNHARVDRLATVRHSRPPNSQALPTRVIERSSDAANTSDEAVVLPSDARTRWSGNLLAVAVFVSVTLAGSAIAWVVVGRPALSARAVAAPPVSVPSSAIVAAQAPAPTARPTEEAAEPTSAPASDPVRTAPVAAAQAPTTVEATRPPYPSVPPKSATKTQAKARGESDIGPEDIVLIERPKASDSASLLRKDWKDASKKQATSTKVLSTKPNPADEDPMNWIIRFDAGPAVHGLQEK